jgi:hypothetical protein
MDFQLNNEELWEAFEKLKAENYHLKRQLVNKNKIINGKDKQIRDMAKKLKEWKPDRQHYKNGKRGTKFNG